MTTTELLFDATTMLFLPDDGFQPDLQLGEEFLVRYKFYRYFGKGNAKVVLEWVFIPQKLKGGPLAGEELAVSYMILLVFW